MKKAPWPFLKCRTPDEFLTQLRKALPYRYKVWKPQWFIADPEMQLRVNLCVKGKGPKKRGHFEYNPNELMVAGSWNRDEARSTEVRKFEGFEHIITGGGSGGADGYTAYFNVGLKHLPLIQKGWMLAKLLAAAREKLLAEDETIEDFRDSIAEREDSIFKREAELLEQHKKKFAEDYNKVAWLPGRW